LGGVVEVVGVVIGVANGAVIGIAGGVAVGIAGSAAVGIASRISRVASKGL